MKNSLKKKLKKGNKTWQTAQERSKTEGFGGPELDDGRYLTKLIDGEINESQKGREQVLLVYKIIKGEDKGEKIRMYQGIDDEDGMMWMHKIISKFGIRLDDLTQIEDLIKALVEAAPEVRLTLKSKDGYQNKYIDRVMSEIELDDFEATDNSEEDDEEDEDEDEDEDKPKKKKKKVKDEEDDDEDEDEDEDDEDEDEDEDKPKKKKDDDEDDEEEDSTDDDDNEDDIDVDVGSMVTFEGKKGKILTGKIVKILKGEEEVKVKVGDKKYTVAAEDLAIAEPEEEEEKPKKKKKSSKKTDKKKKKKKK